MHFTLLLIWYGPCCSCIFCLRMLARVGTANTNGQLSMWGLQVFRPYVCNMREWDQEDFLKCTYKRRIIIIGDMSMHQMFNSMACLLSASIQEGSQVPWEVSGHPLLQR